jgi:hypothetical protein
MGTLGGIRVVYRVGVQGVGVGEGCRMDGIRISPTAPKRQVVFSVSIVHSVHTIHIHIPHTQLDRQ